MSSGVGVSGRLCSGVVQVGERLRVVPGDETAVVRSEFRRHVSRISNTQFEYLLAIERDEETVPYASAGQNVNLYLAGIDPIHLNIGSVLCPLSDLVPLATKFTAQILVFDIAFPLIAGVPVSIFRLENLPHARLTILTSWNCSIIRTMCQLR